MPEYNVYGMPIEEHKADILELIREPNHEKSLDPEKLQNAIDELNRILKEREENHKIKNVVKKTKVKIIGEAVKLPKKLRNGWK
jgi:hypothetical protein